MKKTPFQMNACILCNSDHTQYFYREVGEYDYLQCKNCNLIFVKPDQRLPPAEEKKRYDLHENDPNDEHYRTFLSQLFEPIQKRLLPGSFGLDFGSGPGPTLHKMFEELGHTMNIYDPFYAENPSVFDYRYDFITTTETAEHLFDPQKEFERLWALLKPNGNLGIMTCLAPDLEKFPNWYYRRDDTHVAFYSKETFEWLAKKWNASVDFYGNRVIIFQKRG